MTTMSPAPPSPPEQCTTRDLLEELRAKVIAAKLEQEITSKKVTALEEHLKQLEGYDTKISTAVDGYRTGSGAVAADFAVLRAAVEKSKTKFECLLTKDEREKVADVAGDLRKRRKHLKACTWKLGHEVRDKQCQLEHEKALIVKEEKALELKLARLDRGKTELTVLKALKERIDCSDTLSDACRYAYYLDLLRRVKLEWPTADDYMCELVDQVKELDKARQRVSDLEKELSVLQDQLARVTKLLEDLTGSWLEELCRVVTAKAVPPLAPDLEKACQANGQATDMPPGPAQTDEEEQTPMKPVYEHEGHGPAARQDQGE